MKHIYVYFKDIIFFLFLVFLSFIFFNKFSIFLEIITINIIFVLFIIREGLRIRDINIQNKIIDRCLDIRIYIRKNNIKLPDKFNKRLKEMEIDSYSTWGKQLKLLNYESNMFADYIKSKKDIKNNKTVVSKNNQRNSNVIPFPVK